MSFADTGHRKLYNVITNKKVPIKLNYQELEELNFALSDRFNKIKVSVEDDNYLKSIKKLILKIRNKIDNY